MKSLKRKFVVITAMFIVALMAAPVFAEQRIPSSSSFVIQSASEYGRSDRGCWDVPGNPRSPKKKQNLQLWSLSNLRNKWDRTYRFYHISDGVYEIRSNHRKKVSVDVSGGKYRRNANILLYKSHGKSNQKFKVKHVGGGKWTISPFFAQYLKIIPKSGSTKNGTNLLLGKLNGKRSQWVFLNKTSNRPFIPSVVSSRSSSKPSVNLAQACQKKGYSVNNYFPSVSRSIFSNENRSQSMSSFVNRHPDANRITLVQKIIKATARNKDSLARFYIYREMTKINMPKGFLVNVLKGQIKKDVKKLYKSEKYSPAKNQLKKLYQKL